MRTALGQALDFACLSGIGAENQLLGVTEHPDVNKQAAVGTPDSYAEMTAAVRAILAANYPGEVSSLAWIQKPDIAAVYDGLTDTTGQLLQPTPRAAALKQHPTTAMAPAASEYASVIGDFMQMIIGARTSGFRVDILPAGTVTDADGKEFNAASQFIRFVRVWGRFDVALLRPTWFTVQTGITTT